MSYKHACFPVCTMTITGFLFYFIDPINVCIIAKPTETCVTLHFRFNKNQSSFIKSDVVKQKESLT